MDNYSTPAHLTLLNRMNLPDSTDNCDVCGKLFWIED